MRFAFGLIALAIAGCGKKATTAGEDASAGLPSPADAASFEPIELPDRPLGVAEPADLYRGDPSARERARDAVGARDWGRAVAAARVATSANAADAEAHWLLGQALAATLDYRAAVVSLAAGVALDPVEHAAADLDAEYLAGFIKSPAGAQWRSHLAGVRRSAALQLADSIPFVAEVDGGGELFARVGATKRFVRLSQTQARVVGALPSPGPKRAAVAAVMIRPQPPSTKPARPVDTDAGPPPPTPLSIAILIAVDGKVRSGLARSSVDRLEVYWSRAGNVDLLVAMTDERGSRTTRVIDPSISKIDVRDRAPEPLTPSLTLTPTARQISRTAVPGVAADWDAAGRADVLRLPRWKRTVTLPRGKPVSRDLIRWAPGGQRLAVISEPDGCDGSSSILVVEGATGRVETLAAIPGRVDTRWASDDALVVSTAGELRLIDVESREVFGRWPRPTNAALHLAGARECANPQK